MYPVNIPKCHIKNRKKSGIWMRPEIEVSWSSIFLLFYGLCICGLYCSLIFDWVDVVPTIFPRKCWANLVRFEAINVVSSSGRLVCDTERCAATALGTTPHFQAGWNGPGQSRCKDHIGLLCRVTWWYWSTWCQVLSWLMIFMVMVLEMNIKFSPQVRVAPSVDAGLVLCGSLAHVKLHSFWCCLMRTKRLKIRWSSARGLLAIDKLRRASWEIANAPNAPNATAHRWILTVHRDDSMNFNEL